VNNDKVRVRFAPSPTGYLHVGGARTAIFNWLYARHTGGSFVLRIEDTDVERSTRASEVSLLDDLRWLGLEWDEGPDTGGPFGPYRQSERLDLYRAVAGDFVDRGLAYPCFCSDDELATKREAALKAGGSPHYDGTCRHLTAGEVEERRKAGTPETIRFRVPEDSITIDDLVRGPVTMDTNMVGDFVILRSNGLPTYNFAAAHDDCRMEITHVLRGEEHLPNTLRQILIYRAMDAMPPVFGHAPLILAEDRSKLSKRHAASSLGELRERGYLPGAVVNYLLLLGWSHPEEKEKLAPEEMVTSFEVGRIGKTAAMYDPKKMSWMNGLYIRDLSPEQWMDVAIPRLPDSVRAAYDNETQQQIAVLLQSHVDTLDQLPEQTGIFDDKIRYETDAAEVLAESSSREVLKALSDELSQISDDWTPDNIKACIKRAGKTSGKKGKELFFPVRAAITGNLHGPDLSRVATIKGSETVLRLIGEAVK
jgi:nondiscriminating glutamyl-tRNA synthetase